MRHYQIECDKAKVAFEFLYVAFDCQKVESDVIKMNGILNFFKHSTYETSNAILNRSHSIIKC